MQDTGRSPFHLLLDDRASRDGACGSDRRRRARDLARQPRTLRRQEDQGRLGKEGRHRVQETHRQHHARTGHVGAYTRRQFKLHGTRVNEARREPARPRVRRLRSAHASGERPYLCPRRRRMGVRVPAGRLDEQGHREKSSQGWTLLEGLEDCFSYHAAPVHLLLCNKYETAPYHTQVFRNIFAHIQCNYSSLLLSAGIKGSKSFTGRDSLK